MTEDRFTLSRDGGGGGGSCGPDPGGGGRFRVDCLEAGGLGGKPALEL